MTMDTSKVLRLPRKLQHIFWKRRKRIAPATQNDFRHVAERLNVTKCHACHAKRNNDTLETSKNDHLCRTSHRHGHTEFVRTVADGCDHKRNVERTHPQPPEWNGNPFYAFAKNGKAKEHPILVVAILYPQFFFVFYCCSFTLKWVPGRLSGVSP